MTKPVVAWCIGTCARMFTSEVGENTCISNLSSVCFKQIKSAII